MAGKKMDMKQALSKFEKSAVDKKADKAGAKKIMTKANKKK